jgi:Zinc-finger of the MIZ type in Nse subunit.
MENPVRNTVCGHVYDYSGIKFYMGSRRVRQCPVPGCANRQVTMSQIEHDEEMQLKVKRFLKRMEQVRQQRMSQTQDIDDFE